MRQLRWGLVTLCLNEYQWLPKLYQQHKNFPGMVKWVFVESADREYANANPNMVSEEGLSIDETTDFLQELERLDKRVRHIRFGFSEHEDKAQGKCAARNAYFECLDAYELDYVLVVDADEFWTNQSQSLLQEYIRLFPEHEAFTTPYRVIWYPPYQQNAKAPMFQYEAYGRFWEMEVNRVWKFSKGLRHNQNHNNPDRADGTPIKSKMLRYPEVREQHPNIKIPEFIHMGFAAKPVTRLAKNKYYEDRGEAKDKDRQSHTISRAAWKYWYPMERLPERGRVRNYEGEIPESFLDSGT